MGPLLVVVVDEGIEAVLGRGLRPAPDKADCLVLDHAGNVRRHGFATDDRYWTLDGTRKLDAHQQRVRAGRDEQKLLTCPECCCSFTGSRVCPDCGYYFEPKGRVVATLDGQLVEIGRDLERDCLAELVFYLEIRGIAAELGYQPGYAAHKFRQRIGRFPPFAWNDYDPVTPSLETRRWLKSRQIAYFKAREASVRGASIFLGPSPPCGPHGRLKVHGVPRQRASRLP